jgi:two-component system, NtrC family, sensor kinase
MLTRTMSEGPLKVDASREDALEELRRAERAATVSRLASHIAHELGTPLNVISGRAMMIASGEASGDETIESAKIIVEQTNKLTAMIRQFLAEARKPSNREPTNLLPICDRAFELVARPAERAKVQLVLEAGGEPAVINMEAIKAVQIVTNLLTNAIHAMPEGGVVTVTIHKEQRSPGNDRARPGSSFVCLSVRDQGVGISKEEIPNIFKLFYSTRGSQNGAGLGLSIVQGIVREHGGWIDVDSEIGKGTRITVCLPEGGA